MITKRYVDNIPTLTKAQYEQLLRKLVDIGYSGLSCQEMEEEMDRVLKEYGIKGR